MVKLEENYRSRENILQAANQLIENNTQRIEKVLKPTRGAGEEIYLYRAEDEQDEAGFVLRTTRQLVQENPDLNYGNFAILYRINAQSRPFEELLVQSNILYTIVGGFKFYDRKEIKDALAYLRVLANPSDTVSLLRIINTPRRGIGQTTIDSLLDAAKELNVPLWEIIGDETSVNTMAGRSAKSVNKFVKILKSVAENLENLTAKEILETIMQESGYIEELKQQGTDESEERLENIKELYNAMQQYQEEYEDSTLTGYLSNASLASDLDNLQEGQQKISLMTLHSAKGLEFPIVFLVGLEQGLFPYSRSLSDPLSLEEERRLCYVGVTRAQEQLFLTYAQERFVWGNKEFKTASQFIEELPRDLMSSNIIPKTTSRRKSPDTSPKPKSVGGDVPSPAQWSVGDRVLHKTFGEGEVTHLLGAGKKINLAIRFPSLGQKIVDPKLAALEKLEN
jgi:DNA helicase-2/ATP-dependent DNA helicase PcrA